MAINILTQTQKGGPSAVEQEVIAGAPTADLQERVPQPASLDELLTATPVAAPAPESAPVTEEVGQVAPTPETVPTMAERAQAPTDATRWGARGLPPVASVTGGLDERATNMANMFGNNSAWEGGLAVAPSATPESGGITGALAKAGAILSQDKVQKPDGTAGFQTTLDPTFLLVGSAVTENIITRMAQGKSAVVDFQENKQVGADFDATQGPAELGPGQVSKFQGNQEIGREAYREYSRLKNASEGRPTDQYADISPDDAAIIGDALKEMYSRANPNDLKRVTPEQGGQVFFQITPEGNERLNSKEAVAARAQLFPGTNVRPSKTPVGGQLKTEVGRTATRRATGHVKGQPAGQDLINESKANMSTIPNVVDKQRMKILFATALPALMDQAPVEWSTINNFGVDQAKKYTAEAKKKLRDGELTVEPGQTPEQAVDAYVANTLRTLKGTIAQNIRAVAMERNGANFLTYYTQNFNGRTAPQQSFFDPTTSKAVRFVTRNAVPAMATPGSRIEKNLRQMYAMMLVKGADAAMPRRRDEMLNGATPQLEQWGLMLKEALDNAMTDEQAEALAESISQGQPLNNQQLPVLEVQDPELLAAIASKGEDGPHFIDGLIDFANYMDASRKGKPYASYFNAYMDGKTNGIASNGIQMGSKEVALKTGVMRTGTDMLLDEGDIRDELMKNLTEELESSGLQGTDPNFYVLQRGIYNYRQLAKDTTMTFGYGKELASFKNDIDGVFDLLRESDPEFDAAAEAVLSQGDRESVIETMWTQYTSHLAGALSEEAMTSRPIMRAAATFFGLIDQPFTMTTATGFELRLGGEIAVGELDPRSSQTDYSIYEDGQKKTVTAQQYGTRASAIAAKGDQGIGSRAWGGSLPAPVQSLDAATIAMTTTGRSWKRLKENSGGNPYFHHVYDAVKVDAMGFDTVLEEVNKNWLNASMEWSYLQATLDSLNAASETFAKESAAYPADMPILTGPNDEYAMFGHLTQETESLSGKVGFHALAKRLAGIRENKYNSDPDTWYKEQYEVANKIMKHLIRHGFNWDKPTMGDYRRFMKVFAQEVNLKARLNEMIRHTEKKKAELRSEIRKAAPRKEDTLGYDLSHGGQYYAH